jgi:hypothetical protein
MQRVVPLAYPRHDKPDRQDWVAGYGRCASRVCVSVCALLHTHTHAGTTDSPPSHAPLQVK